MYGKRCAKELGKKYIHVEKKCCQRQKGGLDVIVQWLLLHFRMLLRYKRKIVYKVY